MCCKECGNQQNEASDKVWFKTKKGKLISVITVVAFVAIAFAISFNFGGGTRQQNGDRYRAEGADIADVENELPEQADDTGITVAEDELPEQTDDTGITVAEDELPEQAEGTNIVNAENELPEQADSTGIAVAEDELPEQAEGTNIADVENELPEQADSTGITSTEDELPEQADDTGISVAENELPGQEHSDTKSITLVLEQQQDGIYIKDTIVLNANGDMVQEMREFIEVDFTSLDAQMREQLLEIYEQEVYAQIIEQFEAVEGAVCTGEVVDGRYMMSIVVDTTGDAVAELTEIGFLQLEGDSEGISLKASQESLEAAGYVSEG